MSIRRRVTWLDVFTATPLTGNALAVVLDGDGLGLEVMEGFARETRLSETTFVQPSTEGADYRNRIFMTTGEIPFAGHPSLGTAVAVARSRGERTASYIQETGAGLQPVEVELQGAAARASMLQEPAVFGDELDPGPALAALGLAASDGHPALPVRSVSCGIAHLMIPVRDREVLARAVPVAAELRAVTTATGTRVLYAAAVDDDGRITARGFFDAGAAIEEDAATGSAAGPLCALLHRHAGLDAIVVEQGAAIGRPSRLEAAVEGERVRVSGECVVVLEGELVG